MEPTTLFVDLREGPAAATIPADVAASIAELTADPAYREAVMRTAAVVLVRVGREGGEALLRHWIEHEPSVLMEADPRFMEILAYAPEAVTGPLAGTASRTPA